MLNGMGSELLVGQDAADGLEVSNHVSSFSGRSLLDADGAVFSAPPMSCGTFNCTGVQRLHFSCGSIVRFQQRFAPTRYVCGAE